MCGIALELLHAAQLGDGPSAVAILRPALETGLHARGPDHLGTQQVRASPPWRCAGIGCEAFITAVS